MIEVLVVVVKLAAAGAFALRGYQRGGAAALASIISLVIGLVLAGLSYQPLGQLVGGWFQAPLPAGRVLAYVAVLMLVQVVCMVAYHQLARHRSGLVQWLNTRRWLGAVAGSLEGGLLLVLVVIVVLAIPGADNLKRVLSSSVVAQPVVAAGGYIQRWIALPSQDATQTLTLLTVDPASERTLDLGFTAVNVQPDPVLEQRMLELVNQERTSRGLVALSMNDTARQVARAHSADMFARGYFSHRTPEGRDPFDRMRTGGVRFRAAGENLALAPTLPLAHRGLMDSPGHRANILSDNYRTVGIGIMVSRRHGLMVTQNFTN